MHGLSGPRKRSFTHTTHTTIYIYCVSASWVGFLFICQPHTVHCMWTEKATHTKKNTTRATLQWWHKRRPIVRHKRIVLVAHEQNHALGTSFQLKWHLATIISWVQRKTSNIKHTHTHLNRHTQTHSKSRTSKLVCSARTSILLCLCSAKRHMSNERRSSEDTEFIYLQEDHGRRAVVFRLTGCQSGQTLWVGELKKAKKKLK